ncbi:MAG: single-stranded DNA endonuclease, partial [Peptoniphilus rhinitidis]|nr:single-stranded DNA endonuclease [Peptoniphilus rhinitidis]
MNNIPELEEQIKSVNLNLKGKYDFVFKINNSNFREKLNLNVGKIIKMKKFEKKDLIKYKKTVGVDG